MDPSQGLDSLCDVLISQGRIACAEPGLSGRPGLRGVPRLNAQDCWVLPGLIDMHVHLREPGREEDETLATGTLAAAEGGISTVLAMPNTEPVPDSPARLRRGYARAKKDACVNVLYAASLTKGQGGKRLNDLKALADAGAAAFSEDGRPLADDALLREALVQARRLKLPILDHCEDLELAAGGAFHGDGGIPHAAETCAVLRDLVLAEACGAPLHLCHLSCAASVALVRAAKKRGLAITAEAAPHHLFLTQDDVPSGIKAADFKMNPPLRTSEDRAALRQGLADGTIDAVATDHAPHAAFKKARGPRRAPFGVLGLQTLLPLSLELLRKGILTRRSLVDRLSASPARILGLRSKGHLRRGADADICVVDPHEAWTLEPQGLLSKSRNTPFLGRRMQGRSRAVLVEGRIAFLRPRGQSAHLLSAARKAA